MQTKKKFKSILQIFALVFTTILVGFSFLNLFKPTKANALTDEIDFFVGTTSIKKTNANILSNGNFQTAYENGYKSVYTLDPFGDYVGTEVTDPVTSTTQMEYFFINNYSMVDSAGNAHSSNPKDYIKVTVSTGTEEIIKIEGNRYKKDYIHGYNYLSFPDYTKTIKAEATHILVDDYFCEIVLGSNGNTYKDDTGSEHYTSTSAPDFSDPATKVFIKHNEQYYELTDTNAFTNTVGASGSYTNKVFKAIFDANNNIIGMTEFDYRDVDNNTDPSSPTIPLFAKNENKETAFLPTYYSNNNLTALYIETNSDNSKVTITDASGKHYYRPLFDTVYADKIEYANFENSEDKEIPFITLDNYSQKTNLDYGLSTEQNIQNIYVSLGDAYLESINEIDNIITNLSVTVTLKNKYYTDQKYIKIDDPIIQSLGNGQPNNYFWFEYFDASNVEAYIGGAIDGETEILSHPEGLYTFSFKGTYQNAATDSKTSQEFSCSYQIYLNTNDNDTTYPSFNEEFTSNDNYVHSGYMNDVNSYETFFYNFQEEYFPTYTYDASIYDISVNKNLNLVLTDYEYDFESLNYTNNYVEGNLKSKEYGLVTEYINKTPSKETLIIAEKHALSIENVDATLKTDISDDFDEVIAYSYIYKYRTDNLRTIDYFKSNWGTFQQKILVLAFFDKDLNTSIVKTYKITSSDKVNTSSVLDGVVTADLIKKEKITKTLSISDLSSLSETNDYVNKPITQTLKYSYSVLTGESLFNGLDEKEFSTANFFVKNEAELNIAYFKPDDSTFAYSKGIQNTVESSDGSGSPKTVSYKDVKDSIYSISNVSDIPFEFNYDIIYDDLGVYNIENRYTVSAAIGTKLDSNYENLNESLSVYFNQNGADVLKYIPNSNSDNLLYNPRRTYTYIKEEKDPTTGAVTEITTPINYRKYGYTLHVFGIKSFFNKDGVKTEFKNDEYGIYSDVTYPIKTFIDEYNNTATEKIIFSATSKKMQGITLDTNGYIKDIINTPITNMSPITFDYFGSYSYNNIVPISKYYKYDFAYDNEGKIKIDTDSCKTYYFTKDTFPSDDGYYEIIAEYTYKNYTDIKNQPIYPKTFVQVFAFTIDNSSPSLTFEKLTEVIDSETEKHYDWVNFGKDQFTNDSVRITWAQTTYFQYPVIPQINKTNFAGITKELGSGSTNGFINASDTNAKTQYRVGYYINEGGISKFVALTTTDKKESIYQYKYSNSGLYDVPVMEITLNGTTYSNIYPSDLMDSSLANAIHTTEETNKTIILKKRVNQLYISTNSSVEHVLEVNGDKLTTETSSIGSVWGSGKYQIRLNYGYQSKSYLTQGFTIDNTPLTGINIKRVDLTSSVKTISESTFSNNTKNLIKDPFTFIYDRRASGASIETTYTVVPFGSTINIDKLNLHNSLAGITGTEYVNSKSSSANTVNHYIYDYSFKNIGDEVYANNIFTPNNSALYIFNLKDSAGNTAEYFVSSDLSNPNFFVKTEDEEDYIEKYNIITGLTDVSWGDYKAIEITQEVGGFDDGYIFGKSTNYQATNLEKILKNIHQNESTDMYAGAKLVRTWEIENAGTKTIEQIPVEYLNDNNCLDLNKLFYTDEASGERSYYKEASKINKISTTFEDPTTTINIRYFLLINIRNVNFQYYNTNSDDTSIYSFDYKLQNGQLAKNSTVLSPSRKALIEYWANKGVTITNDQILKDSNHIYGFYGEKKYIYVITDILGNETGNTLWMNLDLTLAMAFGHFTKTSNELTVSSNVALTNLTPYASYTASQIYFSWLVDRENIPSSTIDYKFFNFDLDFYNDYVLTSIENNTENEEYIFLFTNNSDSSDTREIKISYKKYENYNADDEEVNEPVSMFPFELNDVDSWNTIVQDSLNESDPKTMAHYSDENRYFSSLINKINDKEDSGKIVSKPGLYLFRRVYTDYIDQTTGKVINADSEKLGDDTVYRYYLYYIDRNAIYDLSIMPNISNLAYTLGMGMNSADYQTEITKEEFNSKLEKATDENISYSSMKVESLFYSNKSVIQMLLSMDKYNQAKNYENFITNKDYKTNIYEIIEYYADANLTQEQNDEKAYAILLKYIHKYMFGINDVKLETEGFNASKYYNDKFLLRLNLFFGSNLDNSQNNEIIGFKEGKQNLISPANDNTNRYLLDSLKNRPNITNAKTREDLTDGILLTKTNNNTEEAHSLFNYYVGIKDSSGITEGSNMAEWNKFANELSVTFKITYDYPDGYYFGKNNQNGNDYNSSNANATLKNYREKLFQDMTSSLTTNTLQDLNANIISKDNYNILTNTNNETLIFYFEKAKNNLDAQIEPYEISVTKTLPNSSSQVIFKVTLNNGQPVYSSSIPNYTQERLKSALLSDKENIAEGTRWALVIFDNFNGSEYKNLLSNSTDNAKYEVAIQFKGIKEDYSNHTLKDNQNNYFFSSTYEITVDNVKPMYNQIKLMENDKYIKHDKHSLSLPNGYTNIDDYYDTYLKNLSPLDMQATLESIYEYYMESYYVRDKDNNIEYFKDSNNKDILTFNGNKIPQSYIQNYFFAIDNSFEFFDTDAIDTSQLYYREVNPKTYNFSLTKDDFPSTAPESTFRNNSIFDPNSTAQNFRLIENPRLLSNNFGLEVGNYYEIIEKDVAGNYRVYAIFYGEKYDIDYNYTLAENSSFVGGNNGTLNQINNIATIYGTGLNFEVVQNTSNDKFLKAEISITYSSVTTGLNNYKSTKPIEVYLNPIDAKIIINLNGNTIKGNTIILPDELTDDFTQFGFEDYNQEFLNYISKLCDVITSNNKGIGDFSLDIKFINRLGETYLIDYNYPGEELKYIRNGYKITIPADSDYRSTQIIGLSISEYKNGKFNLMSVDKNNKQIIDYNGGKSLGGKEGVTYTLANGTYKIVLTDNFGRVSTYYETYDVNSVSNSISYAGPTSNIDDQIYTAKTTTITYDPSLYLPVFFITDDVTNQTKYYNDSTLIPTDSYYSVTTSSTSTTLTTIGKIIFNQTKNHHTKFNVILLRIENITTNYYTKVKALESSNQLTYTAHEQILQELNMVNFKYDFILYTKLPTLQLKNLNGGIIANNNNQIFIEDLVVLWNEKYNDGLTYDFHAKLKMRRYYNGSNYNYIITTNNYKITLPGDYFLVLTNDLEYESEEIRFTRTEGSTVLYSVYTKTSDGISTQLFESSYTTTSKDNKTVYHYYALNNFNNYNSDGSPIKTADHIDIITNTNNKISYEYIAEESDLLGTDLKPGEVAHAFYKIFSSSQDASGKTNQFVFRYIQINFVQKATGDFSDLKLVCQDGTSYSSISMPSNIIKSTKKEIILFFTHYLDPDADVLQLIGYNQVEGNSITLTHYYNGQFVESVKLDELEQLSLNIEETETKGFAFKITSGGLHRFELRDLAGNVAKFFNYQFINICLINSIVYNINENEPIDGEIFNDEVILEVFTRLENTTLYEEYTIEVFKNSLEYEYEVYGLHKYRFTEAGYYLIRLSANVQLSTNQAIETITTTFSFKIVNPNTTVHTFDISSGNNFRVISIEKKIDISEDTDFVQIPLQSIDSLWLSAEDDSTGTGYYRITLQAYIESLKQYRNFTFNVWLSSTVPSITASIEYGTSTTDPIVLTYNERTIFNSIGESKIVINDIVITTITAASEDRNQTFTLTTAGDYWVQIYTADDKLVASYKVTKNEPLNSNAKLVIFIVAGVVVALTIIFIIIRRRTRFK